MSKHPKLQFPAVHALIEYQGKYLFIKQVVETDKRYEFWDLPGGKIKFNETPYECLVREVREEVGLEVTTHEPVGVMWFIRLNDGNRVVSTVFRCTTDSDKAVLENNPTGENIGEFRWLTAQEYLDQKLEPSDSSLSDIITNLANG